MRMFQINVKGETKSHLFNTIGAAYVWVCKNVMTEEDVEYYKSIGNKTPLNEIQEEYVQEVVLRNAFENVCFSGWTDRFYPDSSYVIFH